MKKKIPLKHADWISAGLWVLGLFFCCLGAAMESVVLVVICYISLIGGLVFHIIFYRCPHCARYLGGSGGKFCRFCGGKLRD